MILQKRSHIYRHLALCLVSFCILTACGHSEHIYKFYPGDVRPNTEIVILKLDPSIYGFKIDGLRINGIDYGSVTLEAGQHEIEWDDDTRGYLVTDKIISIKFEAGHTYTIGTDYDVWGDKGIYHWIRDDNWDGIVAGRRKP